MTDTEKTNDAADEQGGEDGDASAKSRREQIADGLKQPLGVITAMKDAIEDGLREAKERGDLSQERAKEIVKNSLEKAQKRMDQARDAFDFVTHKEFDGLRSKVEELKDRVLNMERKVGGDGKETDEDQS